jgi:GTP-binding protein SAR1
MKVPILLLGNKIDKKSAVSEDELKEAMGIENITTGKDSSKTKKNVRPFEVFMCSIKETIGYGDGLRWLSDFI